MVQAFDRFKSWRKNKYNTMKKAIVYIGLILICLSMVMATKESGYFWIENVNNNVHDDMPDHGTVNVITKEDIITKGEILLGDYRIEFKNPKLKNECYKADAWLYHLKDNAIKGNIEYCLPGFSFTAKFQKGNIVVTGNN